MLQPLSSCSFPEHVIHHRVIVHSRIRSNVRVTYIWFDVFVEPCCPVEGKDAVVLLVPVQIVLRQLQA